MKFHSTFATRFEVMKRFLSGSLGMLFCAHVAPAYQNFGVVLVPPMSPSLSVQAQADPIFFHNAPGALFSVSISFNPVQFSAVNYTNQGTMVGIPGFDFETFPVSIGQKKMAGNFINTPNGLNGGVINCSGFFGGGVNGAGNFFLAQNASLSGKLIIAATNIVHSGQVNMDASGFIKLTGKTIDLTRGALTMASPSQAFTIDTNGNVTVVALGNAGILDGYWGVGTDTNGIVPGGPFGQFTTFPPVISPPHQVTTRQFLTGFSLLSLPNAQAFVSDVLLDPSNRLVQVVFLNNTNQAFQNSVYFLPSLPNQGGESVVQWQWQSTNLITRDAPTNYLYLTDNFGEVTNLRTLANGFAGVNSTRIPDNYSFVQGTPFAPFLTPAPPASSPLTVFPPGVFTNSWSAYQALFTPAAQVVGDVANQDVTNLAGRVEINADTTLDLNETRITALAYLLLKATNHFKGSAGAYIQSPNLDVLLRSTNGVLTSTNLVLPYIDSLLGSVSVDSTRWFEVDAAGVTNRFHVLFVDTQLLPVSPLFIQTLSLKATNSATPGRDSIVISDILNVTKDLLLDAQSLTITSNGPDAFAPFGQLSIQNPNIFWSPATPRLKYLTNSGGITSQNLINFAGNMLNANSSRGLATAYENIINHGGVTNQGTFILAKHFDNDGTIKAFDFGSIDIVAGGACLENGLFSASASQSANVTIACNSLAVSNHGIDAGAAIILSVTNCLTEGHSLFNQFGHVTTNATPYNGGVTNGNYWASGGSFSTLVKPATGDLLSTTVSNSAAPYVTALSFWAGQDRGCAPTGYVNNLAIGRLILDGSTNSRFSFTGVGVSNALYVDRLEVSGTATNFGPGGLTNILIGSNMRIYYAQAIANKTSIAEKLNGRNGGRFCWVSNYAGIFSSTNITYRSGIRYIFNEPLVESCNIDSRQGTVGDNGSPNCSSYSPSIAGTSPQDPVPTNWVFDVVVSNAPCSCDAAPPAGSSSGGVLHSGHPGGSDPTILPFPGDNDSTGTTTNLFSHGQRSYNFNGLFYETNGVTTASAGYFKAYLDKSGKISGQLKLAGKFYPFAGGFDTGGHLVRTNLKSGKNSLGLNLDMQLDLPDGGKINGAVTSSNWTATLRADRLATNATAGKFTFVLPGDAVDSSNSPAGHGFGTLTIKTNGIVYWSGALGDGTSIPETQLSGVSSQGLWPLYYTPYGGAGLVLGWMQFDPNPADSDLRGETIWIKPGGLTGKNVLLYPAGFTNQLEVVGSSYVSPPVTTSNGAVVLSGGNLSQSVSNNFVLSKLKVQKSGPNQFYLGITNSTGVFQGWEITPFNSKTRFQGVLLQKRDEGFGFFLGTNRTGQVWYEPLP